MKTTVTLLFLSILFSLNAFAQDSSQWDLPDGAKARIGKGWISDMQYSPDGTRPCGILYRSGEGDLLGRTE